MLRTRIIPCLLLHHGMLVKTVKFNKFEYVGDPLNTCRIFNELEVDEMAILDISASRENREPDFKVLEKLCCECFMPLSYGGGIKNVEQARRLFACGFEKIIVNSILFSNPDLISQIASIYGTQSIIVSIDVSRSFFMGYQVYSHSGTKRQSVNLMEWAKKVESLGAGEILLTNIDNEGTWSGFDVKLVNMIADAVGIPVIAHGGAGNIFHIGEVIKNGHASAVGLGSMVVFQNKGMGVLVNFPDKKKLDEVLK